MPRTACTFKQSDVTKALRAARDAGLSLARVEIGRDGKIIMVPGKPEAGDISPSAAPDQNEFGD